MKWNTKPVNLIFSAFTIVDPKGFQIFYTLSSVSTYLSFTSCPLYPLTNLLHLVLCIHLTIFYILSSLSTYLSFTCCPLYPLNYLLHPVLCITYLSLTSDPLYPLTYLLHVVLCIRLPIFYILSSASTYLSFTSCPDIYTI